jgi:hypothetical protein
MNATTPRIKMWMACIVMFFPKTGKASRIVKWVRSLTFFLRFFYDFRQAFEKA